MLPPDLEVQLRQVDGVVHVAIEEGTLCLLVNRAHAVPDVVDRCREVLERGLGGPTDIQVSWTGIDPAAAPLPRELSVGSGVEVAWRLGSRGEVRALEVEAPADVDLMILEQELGRLGSGLAAKVRLRRDGSAATPGGAPTDRDGAG
jgi:hypothetical protein